MKKKNLSLNKVSSTENLESSFENKNERRNSIDSRNMDIDEFIKKVQFQENLNQDTDSEKKNDPLLTNNRNCIVAESKPAIEEKKKEHGFLTLLKYRSLRYNFLVCNLLWFVMAFTYYGMSFYLKKGKENIFVDGYVLYLAEGISYSVTGIIMSISFLGRVRSLSLMMMLSAISTFVYYFVSNEVGIYNKIPLFTARFSITAIYSIMYTYSTEIYPTSIRAKGLGLNSFCARLSSILVPIIIEKIDNPFNIFSIMCFFSFFFTFSLPETNNKELEDEILEERTMFNKKISLDTAN